MKKIIKASEEMTEDEKKKWLKNAPAEDLLRCYDTLHMETIKGFCYNPDFELTRAELLKRLGGNVKEVDEKPQKDTNKIFESVVDDMIYQVWENENGAGLSISDVIDMTVEHIETLDKEGQLGIELPNDWVTKVGNIVYDKYDEYEW